jgi:hypothetical protein
MMASNKKILLIIVILALIAGGVFYFLKKSSQPAVGPSGKEEAKTFGEKIYGMVQSPAEKFPQANPFRAEINPFEGLKINPFE